jgi:hypothetical protein
MAVRSYHTRGSGTRFGYLPNGRAGIELAVVCPKAYPLFDEAAQGVIGGAEVDMYYLTTELAKDRAFGVHVICGDYGQSPWQVREGVWLWKWRGGILRLWRLLKWVDADAYLMKTFSWGVPLVWLFCKTHHKKMIYRLAHDWECDGSFKRKRPVLHSVFRFCLRRSDAVLAQTQHQADRLKETL